MFRAAGRSQRPERHVTPVKPPFWLALKQRNTDGEREAIKAVKSAKEIWPGDTSKAAQRDTNARWTLKVGGKQRYRPDDTPLTARRSLEFSASIALVAQTIFRTSSGKA